MSWKQAINKPTAKPAAPKPKFETKDDDWETDISYENNATEKSQRYGSASVPGSGRVDHIDLNTFHDKMKTADQVVKDDFKDKNPTRGYGGRYGTEQVMDKAAEGWSYKADIQKHSSQTDGKKGFGGEYGIDERGKDQAAVGFDYKPTLEKHSSQTDGAKGFGGKYGTDQSAQDKSAVDYSHKETVSKHSSQTDYVAGFGTKQEIQKEKSTKPTVTTRTTPLKPSTKPVETEKSTTTTAKADVGNIRARFENLRKEKEAETAQRVAEERKKRAAADQKLLEQQQSTSNASKESNETSESSSLTPPQSGEPIKNKAETEIATVDSEENVEKPETSSTSEQTDPNVSTVNISSILRQRKSSSASSKNNDDDDEWSDKKDIIDE